MVGRAIYLGSFTQEDHEEEHGIRLAHQDPDSGALTLAGIVAEVSSAGFLAWHPDGNHLYSANQPDAATGYTVAADGGLRVLGSQPTGGKGPCHLTVHPSGRYLLTANYGSGSVSVHPLDAGGVPGERSDLVQHEGSGPNPKRQEGPHAHQVRVDPSGQYVLVADLGLDTVFGYTLDLDSGRLSPAFQGKTAPGAGPRHFVFSTDGFVYVAGELDSTVTAFRFDPSGPTLERVGSAPSIVGSPGELNYPSEIALSGDGRFCYVANRGRDQVTTLAVSGPDVRPVADTPCGGEWPRHLAVVGQHLYVANQRSHDVAHFRLDPDTGVPSPASDPIPTPRPSCILAAPA